MLRTSVLPLLLLPLGLAGNATAQEATFPDLGLTLRFLDLEGFTEAGGNPTQQLKQRWSGKVGASNVTIQLYVLGREKFSLHDPGDLVTFVEHSLAQSDRDAKKTPFSFEDSGPVEGKYGYIAYGWLGKAVRHDQTKPVETYYCLGGILETDAYSIEVSCKPALDDDGEKAVERFLKEGISYEGAESTPNWSDEEVEERWQRSAPDKVLEDSKLMVVRTKYYVILTNVGKGTAKGFGKKIDEAYEQIREVYPFEDVEGQRLLPIFYFVTKNQYSEWYVKNLGGTLEKVSRSGGVASGDVYSTYHQATNAPVHIHEATHQIFKNRLRLGGGGSWFQEGTAEYMSAQPAELSMFKSVAKRIDKDADMDDGDEDKRIADFASFMTIPSMLYSADPQRKTGGSEASDNYAKAASIIEFVRYSKFGEDKFQEYIHAVGAVPRSDLPSIEREIQRVFGVDLAGFEDEWVKYWLKRKPPRKR